MVQVLKSSKPIAKKEHTCNYCNNKISIGEQYNSQSNVFDGDFYVWKAHTRCSEIASKLKMYDDCDEGVGEDDFHESITSEYMRLQSEHNNAEYESDSFKYPSFIDQLNYVCDFHNSKTNG